MCARRFLLAILVLTLMAVAGGFAIFQFGQDVLIRQAVPKGEYRPPPPSSGPDYTQAGNWIARPDMAPEGNPAEWRPQEAPPPRAVPRRVSAFYIHPTTYLERDRWNAPLSGNPLADMRARLFVQSQASAFSNVAEVWAPRYRQAAYGAFLLRSEDAQKALQLAYSDLEAAFEEFLRQVPEGHSIILAGHSQGALHLMRLLAEHNPRLEGRLLAAYVVGWPISTTSDLPALGFPGCSAPDQTGCILSWMSFAQPANPALILDQWRKTPGLTGGERRREDILCVNPITGTEGGEAPPQDNPGTLVPSADLSSAHIEPGRVGARCDDGLLILEGDVPNLGPFLLPGNNYHVYDYALFWWPIMRDADRRARAWLER
jgi:hypothetical protein